MSLPDSPPVSSVSSLSMAFQRRLHVSQAKAAFQSSASARRRRRSAAAAATAAPARGRAGAALARAGLCALPAASRAMQVLGDGRRRQRLLCLANGHYATSCRPMLRLAPVATMPRQRSLCYPRDGLAVCSATGGGIREGGGWGLVVGRGLAPCRGQCCKCTLFASQAQTGVMGHVQDHEKIRENLVPCRARLEATCRPDARYETVRQ